MALQPIQPTTAASPVKASEASLDQQAAAETDSRLGVPADEVTRWIDSWGTDQPLPMPSPRKVP